MSHQIYELMVLGMHPAISYPRRSQIRPRRGDRIAAPTLLGATRSLYGTRAPEPQRPAVRFEALGVVPSVPRSPSPFTSGC